MSRPSRWRICTAVVAAADADRPAASLRHLAHGADGLLQHIGLADNVVDHRLNSRTVYMNPISRFIYWNMNYHVEHHMFPMVPYHALPRLHELIKHDLPVPNPSMWHAYREVWPVLLQAAALRGLFPQARAAADRETLPRGVPRPRRSAAGGRVASPAAERRARLQERNG